MNYAGHETLRAEVALLASSMCDLRTTLKVPEDRYHWQRHGLAERLASSMCDLRTTLKVPEDRYHWQRHGLAERLAGQSLRRINTLLDEAFNESLMLSECFKD
ncbi:hypothetical protein DUG12_25600 [Salmonella enterica]|nr:hypothetical protein [Salmonella enterica]